MPGDWIKMRTELQTHPKVRRIASALRADKFRTIGGLHAVWSLFDAHALDGFLEFYSTDDLDSEIGFPGFARAMEAVEWLVVEVDRLCLPEFDEHNGRSAKRRAEDQKRKRDVRKVSAPQPDKKRTREEKRREEIKTPSESLSAKQQVEGFQLTPEVIAYAKQHGQDAAVLVEEWKDHFRTNGYRTRTGPIKNATAAFRTWIRNAAKFARPSRLTAVPSVLSIGAGVHCAVTVDDVRDIERELRGDWTRTEATPEQARAWVHHIRHDLGGDLTEAPTLKAWADTRRTA